MAHILLSRHIGLVQLALVANSLEPSPFRHSLAFFPLRNVGSRLLHHEMTTMISAAAAAATAAAC